jgi:cation:H+ antiporter
MVWIIFVVSAGIIVLAAVRLAEYGDVIALRTGLGRLFVGAILIAAATSLPEVLTTFNAIAQGEANLAAGNLLGSNMFNMALLAVLDLVFRKRRILRTAALKHALSGSLAVLLIGLVVFFILADIPWQVGWVGGDSLAIMLGYLLAVRLLQRHQHLASGVAEAEEIPPETPSLGVALFGFGLATAALVYVTPWLVRSSAEIAVTTGLGTTFIGTTLVALVTSLPELVTTLSAARLGADDMAIGNLFGSNLFNMFALGLSDVFYTSGRFLAVIDPAFVLVGMLGLILTALALVGNLIRLERRWGMLEADALLIGAIYLAGLWLLYQRGITP